MSVAQRITLTGEERVSRGLQALIGGLSDRQELMEGIGLYLEASTVDRFDSETAPDGSRWTPSLRAKATGGKTLTDHGLLKGSIGYVATNDQVEWGSNLVYARPHQEGATIAAKGGGRLKFRLPGGLGCRPPASRCRRGPSSASTARTNPDLGVAEDYLSGLEPEMLP